jgi:ubiquinone/menaquinone biosynthesis C-methylase UbiE
MTNSEAYPLGYSEAEAKRLAEQAAILEDLTEDLLRRAGLSPGMDVLDAGCGVGDVSLLAARLVGENGSVLGIDRDSSSVETARRRAELQGVKHAAFAQADLTAFEPDRTFDAVIGRLVLLYLPDPAMTLRRLAKFLRPGGIIAFQEYDMMQCAQEPQSPLFAQAAQWIIKGFGAAGAEVNMGAKLYKTYLRAGLPHPAMTSGAPVLGGPAASAGYDQLAGIVRSLLPVIERHGIARAADIEIDTLAERLRSDALANERVLFFPRLVGAWASAGGAV